VAALGLGLAAIGGPAVTGVPLAAASTIPFGSVQVVVATSGLDSNTSKVVTAVCPAGKKVLGGGGLTSGGGPHVLMTELRPISQGSGNVFNVIAIEDTVGTPQPWSVQAFAFCADAPLGLEYVTVNSTNTTAPLTGAFAKCSAGKVLVGSGGRIGSGFGRVALDVIPASLQGGAIAFAKTAGVSTPYLLSSFAVCATGVAAFDTEVVSAISDSGTANPKKVVLQCPAGMGATGVAGWTENNPSVHLLSFKPTTTNAPTAVEVVGTSTDPNASWTVTGFVHCAK
jgi:hypothetical protein